MKNNDLNLFLLAVAAVVIASVQVANFTLDAIDFQSQIDNAYHVGYIDGDADGYTEGIHEADDRINGNPFK